MKKMFFLFLTAFIATQVLYSQVTEYSFAQENLTYSEITGGTVLWSGTFDNEVSGTITIPSFGFDGAVYTSAFVTVNGFITFGTAPAATNYTPISNSAAYAGAISAFGRDLIQAETGSPAIRYQQVGNEFVFQWKDVRRKTIAGEIISFQVRLNTTTNEVKVVYGGTITPGANSTYPQVGLRGPDDTYPANVNNRTIVAAGGNWINSTKGTASSSTMYFNSATPGTVPSAGLTFRWKPLLNPVSFTSAAVNTSQINLNWVKNGAANNVLIAFNTTNTFGTPVNGTSYSAGNTIAGGGTVLYNGSNTSYNHTGLTTGTLYYYKAWSVDGLLDYSNGLSTETRTSMTIPYVQDFNASSSLPTGWAGDMSIISVHGTPSSTVRGLSKRLYSAIPSASGIAPLLGPLTATTHLSFHYRIVDELGYPLTGTTLAANEKIEVQVSADDGATYSTVHTIDQSNHLTSVVFTNKVINLGSYSGQYLKVKFVCTRISGDFYVDIDNFLLEDGTNMSYTTSTTEQLNTGIVALGSTDNDVIRLNIITQKSSNPYSVTSITFNTTGSTNAANDIAAAKVYYTSTPVFSTSTPFGTAFSNPSGTFTITGSKALTSGNNYFWLAYDLKPTATLNNVVDGQCTSFITSESGTAKTPVTTNPTGSRKIGNLVSGVKTIPGNYATIATAVTELNNSVIGSGGVTFNVAAGHTESITAPIILTATGTASNPIVFQKSGTGSNPMVTRTDAGSVTTSTIGNHGDGIIILEGSDYVTFDRIDVAASQQGIEYGYYLRKASVTDGCKNSVITNAVITMTKGTSRFVVGICAANNSASGSNIALESTGGIHESITITGNTIGNVFAGMLFKGEDVAGLYDKNFVVGTSGSGNTIQNFAGNMANDAYGIYLENTENFAVNHNTINNATGGGTNFAAIGYGIFNTSAIPTAFTAGYNTITLASQGATHALYGIRNLGTGITQINNNIFSFSNSTASSGSYYYIANESTDATSSNITIHNNTFAGSYNNTGTVYLIYNNNARVSPAMVSIQNNAISGTLTRTSTTGAFYLYYNNGSPTGTEIISGNDFQNISQSGTSTFLGIYSYTESGHTQQVNNNTIANISSGSGAFIAIDLGTSDYRNIYNNTIRNISTGGTVDVVKLGTGNSICHIYKNQITNISSSSTSTTQGFFNGMLIAYGTAVYVYNNFISDLKASAVSNSDAIRAISITSTQANTFIGLYYNSVFLNASSSGANFGSTAVYHVSGSATTAMLDMRNNILINTSTPAGSGRAVVLRRTNSGLLNFAEGSDNNILYAGTPGSSRVIYYAASGYQTLSDYQTHVAPREGNSHTENPPFVNVTAAPFDLHLSISLPTLAEGTGLPVTSPVIISDDFDGNPRQSSPDIGADEFTGISAFVLNPAAFAAIPASSQGNRLTFTTNSANNDLVIVFNNTGTFTPPSGIPVVGNNLGGGTVIYIGKTSPYNHNGLVLGTTYYYKAFSYDGASYSTGLSANAAPVVSPVAGFTAIAQNQTQINLSWVKNAVNHDVLIARNSSAFAGNPVNGTNYNAGDPLPSGGTVLYKGPATAYNHTGLAVWSQHFYRCWSVDAFNYYSVSASASEVTYANTISTIPYLQNFDGTWSHSPAAPEGWEVIDVGGSGTLTWEKFGLFPSPYFYTAEGSGNQNDWLISPPLTMSGMVNPRLVWWDKVSNAANNNSYKIMLSTTSNQIDDFTVELGDFNCTNTAWTKHTIDLTAYAGQNIWIAFYQYYSATQYSGFDIDLVYLEGILPGTATLVKPLNGKTTLINPELNWSAPVGSEPVTGYRVYFGTNPNPTNLVYNGPNLTFLPTGLVNNTTYYWKVVPYNAFGDASNVPVWTFSTVTPSQLAESFEAPYFPPISWSMDYGYIWESGSFYHGARSARRSTASTPVKLITPLLSVTSGSKLEFFAGTASSTYQRIQIMYSSDKTNWTNLGTEFSVIPGSWNRYEADLSSLAGNNYYLAFGTYYTTGGSGASVYIDHVIGPQIVPVLPIAATNPGPVDFADWVITSPLLSWEPGLTGGIPAGYKLYLGTDGNGTVTPTNILNGLLVTSVSHQVTSILNNATTYYWKIVPTNSLGDAVNCPIWRFITVPANGVPIGQGTEEWLDLPINANYGYNYSQTIYLQSEINIANKRISKIYYYWTGVEAAESSKDWVIYMGHTTNTGFITGNDWIPVSQMLEVFNGEVILPDVAGWVEIILDNPFNYNNTQNLVIAVDENTPDFDDGNFYGTETIEYRSLAYEDDNFDFDPEFPYEGFVVNGFPNIRLQLENLPSGPEFMVTPVSKDFGPLPVQSASDPQTFTIRNNGTGILQINSVQKSGTDVSQFILTDNNTYPVSLAMNQAITVSLVFLPTSIGEKSANLQITDNLTGKSVHLVPLSGSGEPVVNDLPFYETYEDDSPTAEFWSNIAEVGTSQWYHGDGNNGSITSPHGGIFNAFFSATNGDVTKYASPPLNLTGASNPTLSFWFAQEANGGLINEFKVYCRSGITETWTEIYYNNTNVPVWTQVSISLPNPDYNYQIAFEAEHNGGYYTIVDDVSITDQGAAELSLNLKTYLEGAFTGSTSMSTALNPMLPLSQPFNPPLPYLGNPNPVWYYNGSENVASMPSNVVDWVLVEARDAASAATATAATSIGKKAGFLLNNGTITGTDLQPISFQVSVSQSLFVVVYHRNHLAIMSSSGLTESGGVYSWDFTTALSKAFNNGQKALGSYFGLYGGDGDGNSQVLTQDKTGAWNIQAGKVGYLGSDYKLNGQVQNQDKDDIWYPNRNKVSAIP